ncbi:MAG: hypothetical protein P0Y55_15720 [Candidatus Cohnella colombiensis]|uniref:Uncharacterized protein n=1 Tax=Candidatus Cohnella colombiensis TaxID=3121368 RepID=A0AA95JA56_9BACL|nr:MAG: hypothetical protein P0Y55_15720 [Cohnella sp.]
MHRVYPLIIAALLALLLAGCGSSNNSMSTAAPQLSPSPSEQPSESTPNNSATSSNGSEELDDTSTALKNAAEAVIELLRERDLESLTPWIDSKKGLRFSPYTYIHADSDLVFKPAELPTFKDTSKLLWGTADGSGDPIELSFRDYYERYVYNQDFAVAPHVSVNETLAKGSMLFNLKEVYPDASYVEFYFPGFDKASEGLDWQSLMLVFEPSNEEWKLVAIVHGQWTV